MAQIDESNLSERLRWERQDYWLHLEAASPLEKYPAKQHARRVVEKLGVSNGLIYLAGAPNRNNEDSDMPAPFRQRRYFYYLSGCNEPDCHLTYNIQSDTLALFIPRIDPARVIWYGRGSTPAEALDKYDVDEVYYIDELQQFVQRWVEFYKGRLFILHKAQNPLKHPVDEPIDFESLQPAMNLARVVKDEHEIGLIRRANDISSRAHKEVLANILKFKNEAQVEGLFLNVCVSKQAKEQAYAPIAASGKNAGTLHYDDNKEDFDDRQLMCLDAGCEWQLYASDITRTFPLSGTWPSKEAKNIYGLVQRMQETCIGRLKPGVRYLDVHILAHQIAIDGLLQFGIFHNGTREEIYNAGTSKAFFPHGLGHHVGLEVHDPGQGDLMSMTKGNPKYEMAPSLYPQNFHLPVYDAKLCRAPADPQSGHLEEGMVVTVEPGIYFSAYTLNLFYLNDPIHSKYINTEMVARYLPIGGVRIEDDILITAKGYQNLTTAPKGEAMLEIIRSQNAQWPFVSDSADLGPVTRDSGFERQLVEPEVESLLRAPGISRHTPEPILKPITRASTLPTAHTTDRPSPGPFKQPTAFPNSRRAKTLDETNEKQNLSLPIRDASTNATTSASRKPLCGELRAEVTHAYIDFPVQVNGKDLVPAPLRTHEVKPTCRKCTILVQTVGRLRDNLPKAEESSPKFGITPAASRKISSPPLTEEPESIESLESSQKTDAKRFFISPGATVSVETKIHPEMSRRPLQHRQSLPVLTPHKDVIGPIPGAPYSIGKPVLPSPRSSNPKMPNLRSATFERYSNPVAPRSSTSQPAPTESTSRAKNAALEPGLPPSGWRFPMEAEATPNQLLGSRTKITGRENLSPPTAEKGMSPQPHQVPHDSMAPGSFISPPKGARPPGKICIEPGLLAEARRVCLPSTLNSQGACMRCRSRQTEAMCNDKLPCNECIETVRIERLNAHLLRGYSTNGNGFSTLTMSNLRKVACTSCLESGSECNGKQPCNRCSRDPKPCVYARPDELGRSEISNVISIASSKAADGRRVASSPVLLSQPACESHRTQKSMSSHGSYCENNGARIAAPKGASLTSRDANSTVTGSRPTPRGTLCAYPAAKGNGPCARCRLYKISCDGGSPCTHCATVRGQAHRPTFATTSTLATSALAPASASTQSVPLPDRLTSSSATNLTVSASTAPSMNSTPNTSTGLSSGQTMEETVNELRAAMGTLWKVKQELQRLGDAEWGDGRDEGRIEWWDRVEGDMTKAFDKK